MWFQLYVVLDIFSRYVVAWTVQASEDSEVAKTMLEEAMGVHGIPEAVHADRGTSMTSKPVAQLLLDLGVDRSHSGPRVSNDNPFSEAAFKTLKYAPVFPENFGSWPTRGRSVRCSSATTTTSTAIRGSGSTPPRRSTTTPRPRSVPSARSPSTQPMLLTRNGSATVDPSHRNCPPPPGSINPHRRHSYRPRNETCLRLLDNFRDPAVAGSAKRDLAFASWAAEATRWYGEDESTGLARTREPYPEREKTAVWSPPWRG